MADKKNKPLLFSPDTADETERAVNAMDMSRVAENPNWIPGYSEYVIANELSKAEYGSMSYQQRALRYRDLGVDGPKELPVHIKGLRVAGLDGATNDNVAIDLAQYQADGYRPMRVEDLERYGMKMPPLYHVAADGTIRRGDVALHFVDAEGAKRVRDRKDAETKDRETGSNTVGATSGVPIHVEMQRDPNYSL